jgi:putative ABC transport system permease protein
MKLSHIAFRNISRNRRRSILSMSAIAVAALTFVFLFSMIAGMKGDMEYNLQTFFTGQIRIRSADFEKYRHLNPLHLAVDDGMQLVSELERIDGVAEISPRIEFMTAIYHNEINYKARGMGVNFALEQEYQDLDSFIIGGRAPEMGKNEVLIAEGLAKEMGVGIGDRFTLLTQTAGRGLNAITFTISGISRYEMAAMNRSFFQAPLDRVQYFLRMGDSVSEILIKLDDKSRVEEVLPQVHRLLEDEGRTELEAIDWRGMNTTYSFLVLADTIYNIIAFAFFILGSTVIVNTTMMTIYERRREIGTINAMGMEGKEIVRLFFLEAFYIAAIGSAIGVLTGIGITLITMKTGLDFTAAMEGVDMEISDVIRPVLTLKSTIFVFFYSTIVASLASLIPTGKSAKIEPVEALRSV